MARFRYFRIVRFSDFKQNRSKICGIKSYSTLNPWLGVLFLAYCVTLYIYYTCSAAKPRQSKEEKPRIVNGKRRVICIKMDTSVVCLHENLHLMDQCVELLNSQWPRSKTARLRSLEPGPPESFPTSLLLVTKTNQRKTVIGHSKLLPMPQNKEACFVASVIVEKNLRGKGLGRLLMEKTEEFARKKGVKCIYLSTHDKQDFYRTLGYELYDHDPVIYGGGTLNYSKLFGNEDTISQDSSTESDRNGYKEKMTSLNSATEFKNISDLKLKPPPPPPLPKNTITILSNSSHSEIKVNMKKLLSC